MQRSRCRFYISPLKYLLRDDPRVISLSRAAAVAFLIYAPFEYIPAFGDWLIDIVVGQVVFILDTLGHTVTLTDWNIISRNNLRVEIILACTGIQSIAIMLGVAAAVSTTLRQKIFTFLLVAPTIYILNLLRNVFVIMAYTGQYFPYYPEIAGNGEFGYESFFWAHNVIAELLALVLLVAIAYGYVHWSSRTLAISLTTCTSSITRKSGQCFIEVNNPLDCRQVCADCDDDDGYPDITGYPAKD